MAGFAQVSACFEAAKHIANVFKPCLSGPVMRTVAAARILNPSNGPSQLFPEKTNPHGCAAVREP